MPHTYMIFDYGQDEAAAQQARRKLEGWKQAFRLDRKLQFKFERAEPSGNAAGEEKGKPKGAASAAANPRIRLFVRLDFSDHEKLSQHRWLERIPAEDHFKIASPKIIPHGDAEFPQTSALFDSLD